MRANLLKLRIKTLLVSFFFWTHCIFDVRCELTFIGCKARSLLYNINAFCCWPIDPMLCFMKVTRPNAFTLATVRSRTFWRPQWATSKAMTTQFTPTTSGSTTTTLDTESCARKPRVSYVLLEIDENHARKVQTSRQTFKKSWTLRWIHGTLVTLCSEWQWHGTEKCFSFRKQSMVRKWTAKLS